MQRISTAVESKMYTVSVSMHSSTFNSRKLQVSRCSQPARTLITLHKHASRSSTCISHQQTSQEDLLVPASRRRHPQIVLPLLSVPESRDTKDGRISGDTHSNLNYGTIRSSKWPLPPGLTGNLEGCQRRANPLQRLPRAWE